MKGLKQDNEEENKKKKDPWSNIREVSSVQGFLGSSAGKESACNAGDLGSVPWLGRSPAGRHGNPLQYFCLENLHGQRSLVGYSSWGCKESYTAERLSTAQHFFCKRKINSNSGCQNGVSRSAASASRDKLLGINFLRLHPRSTDWRTQRIESNKLCFISTSDDSNALQSLRVTIFIWLRTRL